MPGKIGFRETCGRSLLKGLSEDGSTVNAHFEYTQETFYEYGHCVVDLNPRLVYIKVCRGWEKGYPLGKASKLAI